MSVAGDRGSGWQTQSGNLAHPPAGLVNYLLDTNALSEATKPRPDAAVLAWLEAHEDFTSVSAVSLGEIW